MKFDTPESRALKTEHVQRNAENGIWIDSSWKKSWMVRFGGYSVAQARVEPKQNVFGEIIYRKRWLLVRKGP